MITEKQEKAIMNMRYALGFEHITPKSKDKQGASLEIKKLKEIINHNLRNSFYINPKHNNSTLNSNIKQF